MTGPPDDDAAWAPSPPPPAPAPPPAADSPVLLPGYRQVELVARGGDSVVYRARQDAPERDVAIKVVELDDPETIARFRRELAITVRLGRAHPNIMTVLATGTTTAGQPCLVMDFVELGSLQNRLVERGPLPVSEVVAAGSVVADALAFAHAQGVLHRDVKPQNVLVLPTSWVLADFGLARAIDAGHSASLERFSYRHASPQVLDGEAPTVADDLYSLGSTLFTLLDGRPPFAAENPDEDSALSYLRRARTEDPRPLRRDGVPPGLVAVVTRCLARSRADRFASANELRAALLAVPTETRSWRPAPPAPLAAPTPSIPAAQRPAPTLPAPTQPAPAQPGDTTEPGDPTEAARRTAPTLTEPTPQSPSVSALAHLPALTKTPPADVDATGARPPTTPETDDDPQPPPPGRSRRWLVLAVVAVVALAVGVGVGVWRGTAGNDADRSPSRTPNPTPTRSTRPPLTNPIGSLTASPSAATSYVIDPRIAPTITSFVRHGTAIQFGWTDPSRGRLPFIVYRTDVTPQRAVGNFDRGVRSGLVPNQAASARCFRISTIDTAAAPGRIGLGPQFCAP